MGVEMQLKEGEDYYINDEGLLVFTEAYHLKRGYCCENNCKHCPYPKPNVTAAKKD
jgi:hypothetical protein